MHVGLVLQVRRGLWSRLMQMILKVRVLRVLRLRHRQPRRLLRRPLLLRHGGVQRRHALPVPVLRHVCHLLLRRRRLHGGVLHAAMHDTMHAALHAAMRSIVHAAMHAALHGIMHAALHAALHVAPPHRLVIRPAIGLCCAGPSRTGEARGRWACHAHARRHARKAGLRLRLELHASRRADRVLCLHAWAPAVLRCAAGCCLVRSVHGRVAHRPTVRPCVLH
mmetsp:Transcript_23205/g.59653  ORF Transcript_23205/g.59653 Transcript_23205/m.59653 type:complete len:222 (+) Transcript_23205:160-825(+)